MIIEDILEHIEPLPQQPVENPALAWLKEAKQYFAPGRINLIGEHLDYNGGLVLPAAISLGTTLYIQPTDDQKWHLTTGINDVEMTVDVAEPLRIEKTEHWIDYVLAVGYTLQQSGIQLQGARMHFETTLPVASGLSSSACIEVLVAYALQDIQNLPVDLLQTALLAQRAENEYIGMACGIMDQFVIAHGKQNNAMLLDCQKLTHEYVPLDFGEYKLLILNTKKPRNLIESLYNERKTECEEALAFLKKRNSFLKNLTQAHVHDAKIMPKNSWKNRVMHVVTEHRRVIQAARSLKQNDLQSFGKLLNESHLSLREDYKVTGDELDAIVAVAQRQTGCIGARMTGAGFGGCAIALVHEKNVQSFTEKLIQKYYLRTQLRAEVYVCEIVDGVGRKKE